mgnify:CR=1 FL=1
MLPAQRCLASPPAAAQIRLGFGQALTLVAEAFAAFDPEMGRIRSWGFEDDGAHWQSLWTNDGKSWLLDSRGVLANGTSTSEVSADPPKARKSICTTL